MGRDEVFFEFMDRYFEMSRYISAFQDTLYHYNERKLCITEVRAMIQIEKRASTNLTQLAQIVHRTKGAVSQMIVKLEKMGLVIKKINPENKSEIFLELTEEGREFCKYYHEAEEKIFRTYLDSLDEFSEDEFKCADRLIDSLLNITVEKNRVI